MVLVKTDLVSATAEREGLTKADAEKAVSAMLDIIEETVAKGDAVQIAGFGRFERRYRAERTGINPATGEKITVAAAWSPVFKAGKTFKDNVKNN